MRAKFGLHFVDRTRLRRCSGLHISANSGVLLAAHIEEQQKLLRTAVELTRSYRCPLQTQKQSPKQVEDAKEKLVGDMRVWGRCGR